MKREKQKPISINDAIAALIKGEYDKPIVASGSARNKAVLRGLEALRISFCAAQNSWQWQVKQQQVDIASVAHDLKTPLAIISGYAECLQDGMDDKDYLSLIAEKTAEMNEQVIALVDATRSDVEKAVLTEGESIFAPDFFTLEANKYRKLAEDSKLAFKVGKVPDVKIYASRATLSKILQNLISNAVKYSPEYREVKIKFGVVMHYLKVSVIDTGIGISKSDLKHVFERFYMADKARTHTASSGLGLYITAQAIKELGGHIAVKSKKGKGSKFTVYLPLDERDSVMGIRTTLIDNMRKTDKFAIWFFCGWFMTFYYRFAKFSETRQKTTLIGGLLFVPLFFAGWFLDMLEILLTNKVTFLAN